MQPQELIELCLNIESAIIEVVELKGHWEIWFQNELGRAFKNEGFSVNLEANVYSEQDQRLDVLATKDCKRFFIEIKVESAVCLGLFAGVSLYNAGSDIFKLQKIMSSTDYRGDFDNLWILMVAHSVASKAKLNDLSNDAVPAWYQEGVRVGVFVTDATLF